MLKESKLEELKELETLSEEIVPPSSIFGRLPHSLSALRHYNFRIFWIGQIVSLCGTWMQSIAQGWLVLMITNSAFLLGIVSAVSALPILLFSLVGGIVADHVDKRRLIIFTQIMSMLLALILGLLITFDKARFWNIAFIAGCLGMVNAFDIPARQSFVIETVGKKDLMNAIALNSSAFNIARILGPVIAGFLIGLVGMAPCFYINGISFLAVIVGLMFMKGNFRAQDDSKDKILTKLLTGARYVLGHKEMKYLILLVGMISIFGTSNVILMPVFARDVLEVGSKGLGVLMTAVGFGALAGAVTLALFSHTKQKNTFILLGGIVLSLSLIMFSFLKVYAFSILFLALFGWGMVIQLASINNMLQDEAPDNIRGRVTSFYTLMFLGMAPLGSLQAGFVAHAFNAPFAVGLGGAICLISVVVIGLSGRKVKLW